MKRFLGAAAVLVALAAAVAAWSPANLPRVRGRFVPRVQVQVAPRLDPQAEVRKAEAVPPGPAHAALVAAGYEAVPLYRGHSRRSLYAPAQLGGAALTLYLDTGAATGVFDAAVAARLGLKPSDSKALKNGFGGSQPVRAAQVRGLTLGAVGLTQATWDVGDLAQLIRGTEVSDGLPFGGILGLDVLTYYSAVIDTPGQRLYLLDPAKREARLQGEWLCHWRADGGAGGTDPEFAVRLRVEGTRAFYSVDAGKTFAEYGLALDLAPDPRRMDWRGADGGAYSGVYGYAGSRGQAPAGAVPYLWGDGAISYDERKMIAPEVLTVSMPLYPGHDFASRPTKLTSAAGDKYVTMKFHPKRKV